MQQQGKTVHMAAFRLLAKLGLEVMLFDSLRGFQASCRRLACHVQAFAVFSGSLLALGMISFISFALSCNVLAESTVPAAAAVPTFNILPDTLEEALKSFMQQAGVKVSFDSAEVKGLMTQGLQGKFTVQAGLDQLLVGTGLEAAPQADGYAVKKTPTPPQAATAPSGG